MENRKKSNQKSVNKICLEKILSHITKLICVTEFENIKDLGKLVNMSADISAQLLAVDTSEASYDDYYVKKENYIEE